MSGQGEERSSSVVKRKRPTREGGRNRRGVNRIGASRTFVPRTGPHDILAYSPLYLRGIRTPWRARQGAEGGLIPACVDVRAHGPLNR
jgi:hypothetical protein